VRPVSLLQDVPRDHPPCGDARRARFPLVLRNVEDLLHERGIEVSHETVRFGWRRFGPMFAAEIR
jgi:transposase-like protein